MKKIIVVLSIALLLILPKGVNAAANTLIKKESQTSTEKFWEYAGSITSVTFQNTINVPNGATSWDVSEDQDSTVMAYIIDDGAGTDTYDLYIQVNGTILANVDSSYLFNGFKKLVSISGLNLLDTSNVTSMFGMFNNCESLITLDLSSFDTSNVIRMDAMFFGCDVLTTLNISNFDTSKVTSMVFMFADSKSLTSLNLSNFDTSNVTSMSNMFYGCESLTSLNVSSFNTNNVTDMLQIFANCDSLTTINISNFNTSNVINMRNMFYGCENLSTLDLSNFNTGNVTNMYGMFLFCESLTTLNLISFDTSNVTDIRNMFYGCSALTSLNLSNASFNNVTLSTGMFTYVPTTIEVQTKDAQAAAFIANKLANPSEPDPVSSSSSYGNNTSSSSTDGPIPNPATGIVGVSVIAILVSGIGYLIVNKKKIFNKI